MGAVFTTALFLSWRGIRMEDIVKMRQELTEKISYVDSIISEVEELKEEWEKRIVEAEEAKNNFEELIKYLKIEYNTK